MTILREQDAKFQALEYKIEGSKTDLYRKMKISPKQDLFTECRNKNKDYQQLAQRLHELETRLNLTIEENIDLRATVDILHEQDDSSASNVQGDPILYNNFAKWLLLNPCHTINILF